MSLVGNSIGFLTGALFKDAARASSLAPALLLPLMMFSGLYNKLDSIPVWIRWLQYISPFRYGLHSVLLNEYGNEIYSLNRGGTF
jgi:ABC-type multidrug transport system permease subunit